MYIARERGPVTSGSHPLRTPVITAMATRPKVATPTAMGRAVNRLMRDLPRGEVSVATARRWFNDPKTVSDGCSSPGQHGLGARRDPGPVLPHGVVSELAQPARHLRRRPQVGHLELFGGLLGPLVPPRLRVRARAGVGDPHPE